MSLKNLITFERFQYIPGLYCEGTFDTWLCWPHTAANTTAYEHCPEFVHGFSPERMSYF